MLEQTQFPFSIDTKVVSVMPSKITKTTSVLTKYVLSIALVASVVTGIYIFYNIEDKFQKNKN